MTMIAASAAAHTHRCRESANTTETHRVPRVREAEERRTEDRPRRPPLVEAIKDAIGSLAGAGGEDDEALDKAIADFAGALMHALREGGDRGLHHGHAWGRPAWSAAAQRLERCVERCGESAEPATPSPETPTTPTVVADAATDVEQPPAALPAEATPPPETINVTLRLPDSPWKPVYERLSESFADLQRAAGGEDTPRDESPGEQLREFLAALAAKLRAEAVIAAQMAPPGSLLHCAA